jgi:hypothetical protein
VIPLYLQGRFLFVTTFRQAEGGGGEIPKGGDNPKKFLQISPSGAKLLRNGPWRGFPSTPGGAKKRQIILLILFVVVRKHFILPRLQVLEILREILSHSVYN